MKGSFWHNEKQERVMPCAYETQMSVLVLEDHYEL